MAFFRRTTVLLAVVLLLAAAVAAPAAMAKGSKLSTAPPTNMPSNSAAQTQAGELPRTGLNVVAEALLATMLIGGGAAVRAGSAALRR